MDTYDPGETTMQFVIRPLDSAVKNFPLHRLNLTTNEYYFAVKGKIRPAVVVAGGKSQWQTGSEESLFLCVPLYTVAKEKITQRFVVHVQAGKYPAYFYFPPSYEYGREEAVARFELLQLVHGNSIKLYMKDGDPISLTKEAFGWLKIELCMYLGCNTQDEIRKDLNAYYDLVIEEYEKVINT